MIICPWFELLGAGVCHPGGEQQSVDALLSDQQQEGSVHLEHLSVEVDGSTHRHHTCSRRRLAALLVHLQGHNRFTLIAPAAWNNIQKDSGGQAIGTFGTNPDGTVLKWAGRISH